MFKKQGLTISGAMFPILVSKTSFMSTDEFAILLSEVNDGVSAAVAELATIRLGGIPDKQSALQWKQTSTGTHHFMAFSGVICPKSALRLQGVDVHSIEASGNGL